MEVRDSKIEDIHFPDDGAGADDEIVVEFTNSYRLNIHITPDGERWRVLREGRTVYTRTTVNRGWHENQKVMERLWSGLADNTDLAKEWWSGRIESISTLVSEHDDTAFLTPAARRVLSRTESVKAYQTADNLEFLIEMESPKVSQVDELQQITLENTEILNDDPRSFKVQHHQRFGERIEIGEQDWEVISQAWDDAKTLVRTETDGEDVILMERVIKHLRRRLQARETTDEETFRASDTAVFYQDEESLSGRHDFVGNVAWVKSETVQDALDSVASDKTTGYLGTLSRKFVENNQTYSGTCRPTFDGERFRCYPFRPETLGLEPPVDDESVEDDDSDEGVMNI